jgi:hypothetical protein
VTGAANRKKRLKNTRFTRICITNSSLMYVDELLTIAYENVFGKQLRLWGT